MTEHLVRFDVAPVDETTESRLLADGRFALSTRAGKHAVEADGHSSSAVEVAKSLALDLMSLGVEVREALPELVTMADIARRAGVSKQAVSKWVSGDIFPRPWNSTDTMLLWDWADVNAWLRGRGHGDGGWESLTIAETGQVNVWLSAQPVSPDGADGSTSRV